MGELTTDAPVAVELTVVDDLATLSLGRVDRANALDADTVDALIQAVDEAEEQGCKALVVRAHGATGEELRAHLIAALGRAGAPRRVEIVDGF